MEDLQTIKQLVPELIKMQAITPDIIVEALTSKSLTDLKYKIQKAMKVQKEENNQIGQLTQQLEEAQQQLQQMQGELQKAQQKVQQLDEKRLMLEQEKIQLDYQVNWLKFNSDKVYKERQMNIEEKRTEVEIMQLRDGNPYNDKIKDI